MVHNVRSAARLTGRNREILHVQRLRGEGPPRLGGKGNGDIHYRFVLEVPASLSPEQSEAVDRLSQVMNCNPREGLFAAAAGEGK